MSASTIDAPEADTPADAPAARAPRPAPKSLGGHARVFFGHATPWVMVPALVAVTTWRILVGDWGWGDLLVAGIILGLEPLTEWLIHVYVLHFHPRTVGGRRLDLHAARKHREHHADPSDLGKVFVPMRDLFGIGIFALVLMILLVPGTAPTLTAAMTSLAMVLVYEWTHYIIHTPHRPKSRYYRYIWRAHRLHHFRNEHYWMGVTIHLADHALGTFPQKSEVELSPTARTLGITN